MRRLARRPSGGRLTTAARAGTVGAGDDAIGVAGATGDADQIEAPETLRVALADGAPFQLRGIGFNDFSADKNDSASLLLELYMPTGNATLTIDAIVEASWQPSTPLPLATAVVISNQAGGCALLTSLVVPLGRSSSCAKQRWLWTRVNRFARHARVRDRRSCRPC